MITFKEACSIYIHNRNSYKVSEAYEFEDVYKIVIMPKQEPCDPFLIYPFLVRKSDGAFSEYFPPTHAEKYRNEKGKKLDPPKMYR